MNFETLKQNNKKKYIIGLIVISAIVVTITYIGTRAKYRVTNSIQLAGGVINYSPSDLELVAIKIKNGDGYDNTDTVPTSGYELNTELSVCKVGETKQDVTITYENGKVGISGITTKGTKCEIYFDVGKMLLKEAILANNTIDTSRSSGYFPAAFEENTAGKIFSAEDDDGTTYFFAGSNPNNWVKFGTNTEGQELYWRIIRINGDESIRLIYNGATTDQTSSSTQIESIKFNNFLTSKGENAYVGYMYGTLGSSTYAETHSNTNSSTIKQYLDTWYEENLKINYEQHIDTNAGFCGDRTVDNTVWSTGDGSGKTSANYAPYKRVYNTYIATYKCSNSNDYYTLTTSNKGNKALENPIGLITSDEVMYAGGYKYVSGVAYNYWLALDFSYWTMSPSSFDGSVVRSFIVRFGGEIDTTTTNGTSYVRPVINLKADTLTVGSGTTSDPYRIG